MGDRLTQLQDAVDQVRCTPARTFLFIVLTERIQLAQQFVAALHFVHRRHDLDVLGPEDKVRDMKQEPDQREGTILQHVLRDLSFANSCVQLNRCLPTTFVLD